jgi:hypothetical protein
MRGVKHGWYAVGPNGALISGPFSSHEDCAQEIRYPTRAPINRGSSRHASPGPRPAASCWASRQIQVVPVARLTWAGPFWIIE